MSVRRTTDQPRLIAAIRTVLTSAADQRTRRALARALAFLEASALAQLKTGDARRIEAFLATCEVTVGETTTSADSKTLWAGALAEHGTIKHLPQQLRHTDAAWLRAFARGARPRPNSWLAVLAGGLSGRPQALRQVLAAIGAAGGPSVLTNANTAKGGGGPSGAHRVAAWRARKQRGFP